MPNIEIVGLPELLRKLDRIGGDLAQTLRPPMQRSLNRIVADMSDYPLQRPGSTYRRTGTYGRKWTTAITSHGDGLEGRAGNNIIYGPFVGSKRFQSRVHRGRWATDEDTLHKHLPAITRDFQDAVDEALR